MAITEPGYKPNESDALGLINGEIQGAPEGVWTPDPNQPFNGPTIFTIKSNFLDVMLGGADGDGTGGAVGTYIQAIKEALTFGEIEELNNAAFAGKIRQSIGTLETNIINEINAYAKALQDAIVQMAQSVPASAASMDGEATEFNTEIKDPIN